MCKFAALCFMFIFTFFCQIIFFYDVYLSRSHLRRCLYFFTCAVEKQVRFYEGDEKIKWKRKDYNMLPLEVGYKEEDRRIVLEFLRCPDTDTVFSTLLTFTLLIILALLGRYYYYYKETEH